MFFGLDPSELSPSELEPDEDVPLESLFVLVREPPPSRPDDPESDVPEPLLEPTVPVPPS